MILNDVDCVERPTPDWLVPVTEVCPCTAYLVLPHSREDVANVAKGLICDNCGATLPRLQALDPPPKKPPHPQPICEETLIVPLRWDEHRLNFGCGRRRGHAGDHMCKGFGGRVLKRWLP